MTPNLVVSAKRVLFFTKVILTFLVISILIFLNYLDLKESNRNRAFLCLLKDVYDLTGKSGIDFADYELERIAWLEKKNPALQSKHTDSRNKLVSILNTYGASIGSETKGAGSNINRFVLMTGPDEKQDANFRTPTDGLDEVVVVGYGASRSNGNVNMSLDSFLRYESPAKVNVLTSFSSNALERTLDSIVHVYQQQANHQVPAIDTGSEANSLTSRGGEKIDILGTGGPDVNQMGSPKQKLFRSYLRFEGLLLRDDKILFFVRKSGSGYGGSLNPQQYGGQGSPNSGLESFAVSAETDSVTFPSIFEFVGFDTAVVRGLTNNESKQNELRNLYGRYELDFIDNLSIEAFNKNNNAISILGFDISRKWFPIAMYAVLLVIYTMLYKTIRNASSSSAKIISGYESEETLDFLIDNKWIRFVIWVLTPVFLLFLVLYSTLVNYSWIVYAGLIAAGISCFLVGWISYKRSLKL